MNSNSSLKWLEAWPKAESPRSFAQTKSGTTAWPKVTLVTPSFNQAQHLEACILSVLNQDYPALEFIIQDGGSTDSSVSIIQRYGDLISFWESGPDEGQSHAINKGWAKASGEYLWFINSDDMLTPGSLRSAVKFLEDHPEIDMVFGDLIIVDSSGEFLEYSSFKEFDFPRMLLAGYDLPQAGALIRKSVVDEVGFLDPTLHYVMDLDYWHRVALAGKQIHYLNQPLAIFRVYDSSKTQSGSARAVEERLDVAHRALTHENCPTLVKSQWRKFMSNVYLACARTWVKTHEYQHSMGMLLKGVWVFPMLLLDGRLYYTFGISVLGLLLGERRWRAMRQWVRNIRRNRR